MPSLQQRLQWLRAETRPDMAAILVAAVRRAGEDELQTICEALVDTGEPAALAAVVRRLHRLGPRGLEMLGAAPGGGSIRRCGWFWPGSAEAPRSTPSR